MTGEDDLFDALQRTDPWTAALTPERFESALTDFPLTFAHGWDFARLTWNIQDVAEIGRVQPPQSNSDARKELEKLAQKARALARGLNGTGDTATFEVLWELAPKDEEASNLSSAGTQDFSLMIEPLIQCANLLERSASQIGLRRPQLPRWRDKQNQERRVAFALALMPMFQDAFGIQARADNWQLAYNDEPFWPDFYRRIWNEIFPKADKLNLSQVLQEAARLSPKISGIMRELAEAIPPENWKE